MPVLGQPGNAFHLRLVQNQQHEHIVGYFPFARDSLKACWFEPESRIEVWVPHNHNKWAARVLEVLVPSLDQFATDTFALVFWKHGHGTQSGASHLATYRQRAVHDVTDHWTTQCRD